jgi:hypothetical protein
MVAKKSDKKDVPRHSSPAEWAHRKPVEFNHQSHESLEQHAQSEAVRESRHEREKLGVQLHHHGTHDGRQRDGRRQL